MRIAALLVVASLVACGGKDRPEKEQDEGVPPVSVVSKETVVLGDVAMVLSASAMVESEASADVVPEANGIVTSISAEEGDPVYRGAVLATVNNVALGAGAERSRAEVQRLERLVRRTEDLMKQGAVSASELEDLQYQLRSARTNAREASKTFGQTRLVAPFDGVVAMRNVRVGELATPSSVAFQLVDLSQLRVVAELPERDLAKVAVNQVAVLQSAYDESVKADGVVERISPVVDPATGTFRVTLGLEAGQNTLRPGQFVSVNLEVDRRHDVLVVPKKAVVWDDGSPVVFRTRAMTEEEQEKFVEEEEEEESAGSWWPFGGDGDADAKNGADAADGDADGADAKDGAGANDGDDAEEGDDAKGKKKEKDPPPEFAVDRIRIKVGLVDEDSVQVLAGLSAGDDIITIGQSHLQDGGFVRVGVKTGPPEDGDKPSDDKGSDATDDNASDDDDASGQADDDGEQP